MSTVSAPETPKNRYQLRVDGMTCGHCSETLGKALRAVPGVVTAEANHASGTAEITFTGKPNLEGWRKAVSGAGYTLLDENDTERASVRERARANRELKLLLWSFAWTIPVLGIHYLGWFGHGTHDASHGTGLAAWIVFICASVLQPTSAITYYRGAIKALKRRQADMDVLVSVGVLSGYLYATLSTFLPTSFPGNAMEFFEAATLLICFIRLGKWMEASARARAAEAMSSLLSLTPAKVRLVTPEGEREIAATDLKRGDLFAVLPGDTFAVDGEVVEGEAYCDEAVITGESRPVRKAVGQTVVSGAGNLSSKVIIRATAVGDQTTVARIVAMVEHAQAEKAPIQRMADRISAIFVPVVVAIALASAIFWTVSGEGTARVLTHFIGVLVIACPCALGLAVPAAIMIGSAAGMRRGVLVRNGAALERLEKLSMIVFDKTGTLTEGRPRVVRTVILGNLSELDVARLVLPAITASRHPASAAASEWARVALAADPPPDAAAYQATDAKERAGAGVEFLTRDRRVRIGRALFALAGPVTANQTPEVKQAAEALEATVVSTGSVTFVSVDGEPIAALLSEDPIRAEAQSVISDLHRRGIKTALISGDREDAVAAVAKQLGIDVHASGVSPGGKLKKIREWQKEGALVGMVGDGVNDAPALAQSSLGIAMGGGAGISQQAGDIVLMGRGLSGLSTGIELSHRVRRGIRLNLFASLIYNVIGIPLAAGVAALFWPGVVIPPSYAALAMVMSDASVVGSSWWLSRRLRGL